MSSMRSTTFAYAAFVLAATLALWFYTGGGRVAYTMDSLTYRDAALNLLAGHSLSATNVRDEAPEFVPLLQWPPGYPSLWAAMAALTGLEIDAVPRLLAPLLLASTALTLFWAALLLAGRPAIATLIAVAHAATPSSMAVFGHAWSETVFLPLVVLAFAAQRQYVLHAGQTMKSLPWLVLAALCIGLANWIRYTGAVFLLLLLLTVLASPDRPFAFRAKHAALAAMTGGVLVAPLWLRNFGLTGTLSGSERGGMARDPIGRLFGDIGAIGDLFEHAVFNFDVMLSAHLATPMLVVAVVFLIRAVRKGGVASLGASIDGPALFWGTANLVFLLQARIYQRDVDLDFRMLAVAVPFLFLAFVPLAAQAMSRSATVWMKGFAALVLGLLMHTGLQEAARVHANYATDKAPAWRASFSYIYRDLSPASSESRAIKEKIGALAPGTLVLTDYRALYIRYLSAVRAYAVGDEATCRDWLVRHAQGVLLTGYQEDDTAGEAGAWAAQCIGVNPAWRVLRVTGRGAHSLSANE